MRTSCVARGVLAERSFSVGPRDAGRLFGEVAIRESRIASRALIESCSRLAVSRRCVSSVELIAAVYLSRRSLAEGG